MCIYTPLLQFQESLYEKIGQWVAMSILQDGFGIPIFSPRVYEYIVTNNINVPVSCDEIADPRIKHIVSLVSE